MTPSADDAFYEPELSFIHHTGFGDFAAASAPGLLDILRDRGIGRGLVVDLGCGSGIWARALTEAGYDVLGIDISPAMVKLAAETAPHAEFRRASIQSAELPSCAAVTALGEVVAYLPPEGATDLPSLAHRVYDSLDPGGVWVFDVIERDREAPMHYSAERQGTDWRIEVLVEEDAELALLTRHIRTHRRTPTGSRRSEEVHRLRTYDRDHVAATLGRVGFEVEILHRYGAHPLPPRRVAFVARKPRPGQRH